VPASPPEANAKPHARAHSDRERFAAAAPHSPFHRDMRQTVEGVSLLNVSLKKLTFKEHYFFLFDDYMLEVSLPTKSGKYKFIRYAYRVELSSLLQQHATRTRSFD
jgi:hypothetical protein